MKLSARQKEQRRYEASELAFGAMDAMANSNAKQAEQLCEQALAINPDCVDALAILAEIKCEITRDYVEEMRKVIEAGRRDLGPKFFKDYHGEFWGFIETRPFMRAMATLAFELLAWGTPERIDEAVTIFEEMIELNPNDNQGVRDWLGGCYLRRKRYTEASALFERYKDDWLAAPAWSRVLLAHVTGDETEAKRLLAEARERNPHVEAYLNGKKRIPRKRAPMYSPGDETEAVYCADMLYPAWKAHPASKKWLTAQAPS